MKTKILFVFLFIATFLIQSAQPFTLLGGKWPKGVMRYFINPRNSDMSQEEALAAIKTGARNWRPWCRTAFMGITTEKRVKKDGQNNVFFRSSEYVALASTYVFSSGNEILDVDIVFWDNPWKFYSGIDGCQNGYYLVDVATHEFGHAIGIGHTKRKAATMFPNCGLCNNRVRTLELDDVNAATRLYGTTQAL